MKKNLFQEIFFKEIILFFLRAYLFKDINFSIDDFKTPKDAFSLLLIKIFI